MFTGIIEATGRIVASEARGGDRRLTVAAPDLDLSQVAVGDSIAVSGCCLTVVAAEGERLVFDVSRESLALTTLGELAVDARVNLERALRLADRLGGHLVSGHVDGIGTIEAVTPDARAQRWRIGAPHALSRYLARKGSVAVDGASLTVNAVAGDAFEVSLIPHTLAATTFGARRVGDRVNLEIDLLARYLERLLETVEH